MLTFLVLLAGLISLVILPADGLVALFAYYISDYMSPCCHISFHGFALPYVHNRGEEEGFAMLASEISRDDVVKVCEMGFAVLRIISQRDSEN
jgi:hypothetical protein